MSLLRRAIRNAIFTPSARGQIGEAKISTKLNMMNVFGYNGRCLKNVYIPRANGGTSEIDLLYITTKGLFVIESKNYSGYIFGNGNQRQWTSTLYAGKSWFGGNKVEKYKFYNPIWQNNTHIKVLRDYIGPIAAFSFIVFGDNCELKNVSHQEGNIWICRESNLGRTIKQVWDYSDNIYDEQKINDIYNRLLPLTNVSVATKQEHIANINRVKNGEVCPRCGGALVLRSAKQGAYVGKNFYGCSNFPKCRYIRNI